MGKKKARKLRSRATTNKMNAFSLSFSATLIPLKFPRDINNRFVTVSSPKAIKNQHRPRTRRSIKVPGFNSGMVAESGNVHSRAVPTSVPVRVANELLVAGYHYLDVRSPEEFSAGHVVGAVNVPFMLRLGQGMALNPKFLEQVMIQFSKYDEIVVGSELGKRSFMAAWELESAGFYGIIDMAGGYAVWEQVGLPSTK